MPRLSALSSALLVAAGWAQDADMQKVLEQHNLYRCMHGLPDLAWDTDVAANAQEWASAGNYQHSTSEQRVINGQHCGENLAWGSPTMTGVLATQNWYKEIEYTSPYGTADSPQDSTPAGKAIGHYTQVVWASSSKLGCGIGKATVNDMQGDYWVCQYCTAGNFVGQYSQNVPAPIKSPEACGGTSGDVPSNFPTSLGSESTGAGTHAGAPTTPATATVPPPGNANMGGLGMDTGMGGAAGAFGTGTGGYISGSVSITGVTQEEFCKNEAAIDAVKKGIAEVAGVPASSVRAWCQNTFARRLDDGTESRRLQAPLTVEYTIQVPDGLNAEEIALRLRENPGELQNAINSALRTGTPFQVRVNGVMATVVAGGGALESMPAAGSAVSSAGSAAAIGSFSGLFQLQSMLIKVAGGSTPTLTSTLAASVLVVASGVFASRLRRQPLLTSHTMTEDAVQQVAHGAVE